MVTPGDRWLVCLSGGKDSYTLLAVLTELGWRGLLPVEILACNLDQGQPGFPATVLPDFLTRMGVPHRIEYRDTYSDRHRQGPRRAAPTAPSARGCGAATSTASPARRAAPRSCSATTATTSSRPSSSTSSTAAPSPPWPPKLRNEDGDLLVLRPLAHVAEADCARFADRDGLPDHPLRPLRQPGRPAARRRSSGCSTSWEAQSPGRRQILFRALTRVRPGQLLDPGAPRLRRDLTVHALTFRAARLLNPARAMPGERGTVRDGRPEQEPDPRDRAQLPRHPASGSSCSRRRSRRRTSRRPRPRRTAPSRRPRPAPPPARRRSSPLRAPGRSRRRSPPASGCRSAPPGSRARCR